MRLGLTIYRIFLAGVAHLWVCLDGLSFFISLFSDSVMSSLLPVIIPFLGFLKIGVRSFTPVDIRADMGPEIVSSEDVTPTKSPRVGSERKVAAYLGAAFLVIIFRVLIFSIFSDGGVSSTLNENALSGGGTDLDLASTVGSGGGDYILTEADFSAIAANRDA